MLQFNQSNWLKKYIDVKNHHRTLAKAHLNKTFSNYSIMLSMARLWKMSIRETIKIVNGWQKSKNDWEPDH